MQIRLAAFLAGLSIFISTPVLAVDDPFAFHDPMSSDGAKRTYVGGALHYSSFSGYCDGASSCDDTDVSWQLYGGYRFQEDIHVEGQYIRAGDVQNASANRRSEVSGFGLNGVKLLKLNNELDIHAKAGMLWWFSDNSDGDRDGIDLTFGLGARYQIGENMRLRGDWQRILDVETSLSTSSDIDLFSLGVEMDLPW